ncbi:MAG: lytic murein transglycosylase [Alphaproteobacteria bacterium]|nr:lytic murein transglycosylase [Alphaproteobacteria bacterium]MBL7097702.1 lytic murein transglycosylase [Alphaproteobacteria bacterium]
MQPLIKAALAAVALTLVAAPPAEARRPRHHSVAPAPVPSPPAGPQDIKFAQFIQDFRATALAAGITPATYDLAMSGLHRAASIEALNASQPEFVKPIWSYLDSAVSPTRISDGQRKLAEKAQMLAGIEAKYGVPREILVSIWGNETDYGRGNGEFNIFQALATLAYDGPRAEFGRTELLAALKMLQQEHLDPKQMTSSWAGAFGQLQMLPSTFLKSAVDGDGDGKRDLWHSSADALASAAVEVSSDGWERGHGWGYEVRLPPDFAYEQASGDLLKSIADWSALGVRTIDGRALPADAEQAVIYIPAGRRGPAFLAFNNFKVILKYNNAVSYALAVCTLADQIAGRPGIQAAWPRDEQPLSQDERIAMQNALVKLGYPLEKIDGILGRGTRAQLRLYQKARGLPADGFPTMQLLAAILVEVKQKGL